MSLIEGRYSPTPDNPLTSDKIDALAMDANRRLLVAVAGFSYANISTATTMTVKSGSGFLHAITVNTPVASDVIELYDSTTGSGTTIGTISLPSTVGNPFTITFDVTFTTGLTVVTSGAVDLTVSYR